MSRRAAHTILAIDDAGRLIEVIPRLQRGNDHEQLCWLVRRVLGAPDAAVPPAPTFGLVNS